MVQLVSNMPELEGLFRAHPKLVIDFKATWCGPCKMMHPVVEKLDGKNGVKFVEVDVDDADQIAAHYAIRSMPTLLFFKDGVEVGRVSGFRNEEQLSAEAQKFFA